jgi:hypothetical protein
MGTAISRARSRPIEWLGAKYKLGAMGHRVSNLFPNGKNLFTTVKNLVQ